MQSNCNSVNANFTRIITPDRLKNITKELMNTTNASNSNLKTMLTESNRKMELKGYVGFDRIAFQCVDKSINEGFAFNILCVGETGMGKSTLMNTLFNTDFELEPSKHYKEKVSLNVNTFELSEKEIKLKLTLIETSGYGDQINKANSHDSILQYVNEHYEKYLQEELSLKRCFRQIEDTRVHVCLYFVCPTGHSLKALDLQTMKALDKKLNIIPIIAKADNVSKQELADFKRRIMSELNENNVNIYQFPVDENDLEINTLNANSNASFPLAVIGSSELVRVGSKMTKGRHYEWGTVSVENESHCDFSKLREMLLCTNMLDLIQVTHNKHYQIYRAQRLREIGFRDEDEESCVDDEDKPKPRNIIDVFNLKRNELNEEIQRKELEIKEEFVKKVKDKEIELREREKELNLKYSVWKREQTEWSDRIEHKRRDLEAQIREFSERKFTLERSKLSTLNSNTKTMKKR